MFRVRGNDGPLPYVLPSAEPWPTDAPPSGAHAQRVGASQQQFMAPTII
jgi:hypothetical protein